MASCTLEASDGYLLICTHNSNNCPNRVKWKLLRGDGSWDGHAACDEHTNPTEHDGWANG